jgi:hypothetical protein
MRPHGIVLFDPFANPQGNVWIFEQFLLADTHIEAHPSLGWRLVFDWLPFSVQPRRIWSELIEHWQPIDAKYWHQQPRGQATLGFIEAQALELGVAIMANNGAIAAGMDDFQGYARALGELFEVMGQEIGGHINHAPPPIVEVRG